jgi:hypothetical protein
VDEFEMLAPWVKQDLGSADAAATAEGSLTRLG